MCLYRFGVIDESAIRQRFEALTPVLDERGRRWFAAAEARSAGHGGVSAVTRATGIARSTIGRGLAELRAVETPISERVRRCGGGRRRGMTGTGSAGNCGARYRAARWASGPRIAAGPIRYS